MPANPHPLDAAARDELARKAERVVAHGAEPWIPAASFSDDGYSDDVAQFLAACSPKRILALLAAVERGEAELQRVAEECGQPDAWASAAQLVRAKLMHYDELIAERDSAHVALTVASVAVRDLNILVSNLPPRRATHKESTAIREGFERVIAAIEAARPTTRPETNHGND